MSDIILSTLNAKYIHTAFGLRYLYANLGELKARACIEEFTISSRPIDIAEKLLAHDPVIIGFSVYIWNITETTELVALLKQVAPHVKIVLGGPEVSHETQQQDIVKLSDYVITGAGELSFRQLCEQILAGQAPLNKVLTGIAVTLDELALPYDDYSDEDIATRIVYVEASRGCPFKCAFCLSALDKTAKPFELGLFLEEMERLYRRGLRHFKFIDRTFNLKVKTTVAILEFFLDELYQKEDEIFLHFELIPDHLPDALKDIIQRFPVGTIQFEVGIQTFDPAVQQLISRRQNNEKSKANLKWLREESNAHLHTDLIFGLPGEDLESFADSFRQLVALNPHEIQLGILKRLRGSPIIKLTEAYQLVFNPLPPYNILTTDRVDFKTMQKVNRFARYWDMIGNSGKFTTMLPLLLGDDAFSNFWIVSESLYARSQQTHKISLKRLFDFVYEIATSDLRVPIADVKVALKKDFDATLMKGIPEYLRDKIANAQSRPSKMKYMARNKRQVNHLR